MMPVLLGLRAKIRYGLPTSSAPIQEKCTCPGRSAMRNRSWSRRDLLRVSTTRAAGTLFAAPARAAAPPPAEVTPDLIAAARREGKLFYYSALELNVAERLAKAFEAKYQGISARVERSVRSGFFSVSRKSRAAASSPLMSPIRPIPPIISTGKERNGSPLTSPKMSPIFPCGSGRSRWDLCHVMRLDRGHRLQYQPREA